ncbi:MAG: GGDEF domain-containing protein [Nitratireductor sp.]|nr:GGDEF domain-containing protein [Nitratireductor sp.]
MGSLHAENRRNALLGRETAILSCRAASGGSRVFCPDRYPRHAAQQPGAHADGQAGADLQDPGQHRSADRHAQRRYFEAALAGYLKEFNAVKATLGLLILDLDHFKSINDNYGHDVGDIVLKEVALRMRAISRDHDIVARLGGEEFAVITPYANREQLLGVAERYRNMVEALAIKHGNIVIRPTVSIGVATNEGEMDNADDLFKSADQKLYQAKNAGRNRVAA